MHPRCGSRPTFPVEDAGLVQSFGHLLKAASLTLHRLPTQCPHPLENRPLAFRLILQTTDGELLYGFSLGAGVASRLAEERSFSAAIFEAAPYRTCLFYEDRYFGFPLCRLMWSERYDIIDHLRKHLVAQEAGERVAHGDQSGQRPGLSDHARAGRWRSAA